jgi:hypothetical protein
MMIGLSVSVSKEREEGNMQDQFPGNQTRHMERLSAQRHANGMPIFTVNAEHERKI